MNNRIWKVILSATLLGGAAGVAAANDSDHSAFNDGRDNLQGDTFKIHDPGYYDYTGQNWKPKGVVSAPEIDPASGMSALALLMGSVAILRGRRHRK
jgi:hypothetical protein